MDLNLDLSDVQVNKIVTCTIEGIMEEEDLQALVLAPAGGGAEVPAKAPREPENPADLKKIREKHHSVARLAASGMTQRLIASVSGYTESYVSVLLNSPAMQELVDMYRMQQGSQAAVIAERLRTVGLKALEAIDEKLDSDEDLDVHALAAVAKLGLDRAGHGPTSTQKVTTENHLIDHARLAELNERAREGSKPRILPRTPALPKPEDS